MPTQSGTNAPRADGLLTVLYYLGASALFTHEMDAVMHAEWRLLFVLKNLSDAAAYPIFVGLHLPAFFAFFWLGHHPRARIRGIFRTAISAFLPIHAVIHFAHIGQPNYGFEGLLSNVLIASAAVFGLAYVLVTLRRGRREAQLGQASG